MSAEPSRGGYWEAIGTLGRTRWPVAAGIALALAVLAATIFASLLHLRRHIFAQITNRDGETLDAVAAMQYQDDKANDESATSLEDPAEQIQLALKISQRQPNVLGVRLFSPGGKFVIAFPEYITEASLPASDLEVLRTLRPVSHFVPRARLEDQDLLAETNSAPVALQVIYVPLREARVQRLMGIAQFLMSGTSLAREYAELDKHLAFQGVLAFLISGTIVAVGLVLAFRRVQRANLLLAERTGSLLKANQELALAAKTSAVGAVTSHLIHGLKNPLSGLQSFVKDRAQGQVDTPDSDWQLAVASAQRMQMLIDRVVRVLQEQLSAADYQMSYAELVETISAKVQPVARAAGVRIVTTLNASGEVSNREADLILLILENLLQNAIEAIPPGKTVQLRMFSEGSRVLMEVEDEGPGLSPEMAGRLFIPCASNKKSGSGIGLAISRQLAGHIGATLVLKHSSPKGCCFQLLLPASGLAAGLTSREHSSPAEATASPAVLDSVLANAGPKRTE